MSKRSIFKWFAISTVILVLLCAGFGYWCVSLLPTGTSNLSAELTRPQELTYLSMDSIPYRGKILTVVTSSDSMGTSGKSTGYELTELSRAYYVFQANGFEVDVASPQGGKPSMIIDDDDIGAYDYAFLNDPVARKKVNNTLSMSEVSADEYDAIYFVGGKGAMYDFPDNGYIQSIVSNYYLSGKVIGAVCHGPAALTHVTLPDGSPLLANKRVSSFTNQEELLLIPDAAEIFPFLLQEELTRQGAIFEEGGLFLNQVSQDGHLVTGQNPWSTWAVAETMIRQLGYEPKARVITAEEYAINILADYDNEGFQKAKDTLLEYYEGNEVKPDRVLLAVHSIVGIMQWDIFKAIDMIRLVSYAKSLSEEMS